MGSSHTYRYINANVNTYALDIDISSTSLNEYTTGDGIKNTTFTATTSGTYLALAFGGASDKNTTSTITSTGTILANDSFTGYLSNACSIINLSSGNTVTLQSTGGSYGRHLFIVLKLSKSLSSATLSVSGSKKVSVDYGCFIDPISNGANNTYIVVGLELDRSGFDNANNALNCNGCRTTNKYMYYTALSNSLRATVRIAKAIDNPSFSLIPDQHLDYPQQLLVAYAFTYN